MNKIRGIHFWILVVHAYWNNNLENPTRSYDVLENLENPCYIYFSEA
jgi:hypothetical protein